MAAGSEVEVELNPHIKVFYTTRNGGVSEGVFSSNNLGLHVNDDPKAVLANRLALEKAVGRPVFFMNQTHSDVVLEVNDSMFISNQDMFDSKAPVSAGPDCDGMVTQSRNFALAVLTADCLPLILYTQDGSVTAAVHCGWKGVYRGIIGNAVKLIKSRSSSEICAYLGPCIGPESFEVSEDLLFKFTEVLSERAKDCFKAKPNGKYLCSLPGLCELNLRSLGVNRIVNSSLDTYQETDTLYSYRRSSATGRMATVVLSL